MPKVPYFASHRVESNFKIVQKLSNRGHVYEHSLEDLTIEENDLQANIEPYQNNQHAHSVMSIAYSPQSKFIYSGSVDASFGTWKTDLTADPSLSTPLSNTMSLVKGSTATEYIKSQVLRMNVVDYSGRTYVVTNLMGLYIKVYEWRSAAPSVYTLKTPDTLENFKFESLGSRHYLMLPSSPILIAMRERFNLYKYDISSQTLIINLRNNFEMLSIWPLAKNRDYFFSVSHSTSTTGQYINHDLRIHDSSSMSFIDTLTLEESIRRVVDTEGTFRTIFPGETEAAYKKNLLLHQREIIIFYRSGRAAAYRYWQEDASGTTSLGDLKGKYTVRANGAAPVRKWGRIHGYYAIDSAVRVHGSPHIFTGSGDGQVLLWDFTSDPGVGTDGSPNPPQILDTWLVGRSSMDITYVEDKSLIYSALALPSINDGSVINSIVSRRVCRIENCVYCNGPEDPNCFGCRAGYSLVDSGSHCIACGDPNLSLDNARYCPNRRPWDVLQRETISPNLNHVVTDTFGKSVTIKTSGLIFEIIV